MLHFASEHAAHTSSSFLKALAKQQQHDSQVATSLSALRPFLPSLQRDNDRGGLASSDWMPRELRRLVTFHNLESDVFRLRASDPTTLAHLRRRFCPSLRNCL